MINIKQNIYNWLINIGLEADTAYHIKNLIIFVAIIIIAVLVYYTLRFLLRTVIKKAASKTKTQVDDIIIQRNVFARLSHLAPALIIYYSINLVFDNNEGFVSLIETSMKIYIILIFMFVLLALFNALSDIYSLKSKNKNASIKSYVQVSKILTTFIGSLVVLSVVIDKDFTAIFTGLGAFAAILMLIFQDSIKGFIGGIMLASNDMVRLGDWISMPSHNADGTVIDISLNTVKVQNWDKTISTIPTYSMVTQSFSNWRGMEESGGRRIKRSVFLDINSIKFCDTEMVERYKKMNLLKPYLDSILNELNEYNKNEDSESKTNIRNLTNIGVFRVYLEEYLKKNEYIRTDMTFIIRQLPSTEKGLPMEIYIFSKIQEWREYEQIQSDIFDHIFAILHEFELMPFQNPTGADFKTLKN